MNPFAFLSGLSGMGPLIGVVLVLAWGAAGYALGDHQRNNAWLAKQVTVERQAHQAYVAEVERGNTAAKSFTEEYAALTQDFSTLEGKLHDIRKRTPLLVNRNRTGSAVVDCGVDRPVHTPGPEQPSKDQSAANVEPPTGHLDAPPRHGDGDVALSLGAVWLWNSALTARNTPAGACGAAGAPESACAADAGLGLEAAWDNHALNAKTCALDRLRHQRLIDYVTALPQPATAP